MITFPAIFTNFRPKNVIIICLTQTAIFTAKIANVFASCWGKNILKILTLSLGVGNKEFR
jgi:hypothetical protein